MSAAVIRQATADELPQVGQMYLRLDAHYRQFSYHFPPVANAGELWLESFRRTLGRFSVLLVAELDGKLAGFTLGRLKRTPPYLGGHLAGEISDVWVEPAARGHGLGEALNLAAIEWLRQNGAHTVEAQVLFGNEPIWYLYEKLGFAPELRQVRLSFPAAAPTDGEAGENA